MSNTSIRAEPGIQSPSELYHEASKLGDRDSILLTIASINNHPKMRRLISRPASSQRCLTTVELPKNLDVLDQRVKQLFQQRKSSRDFSGEQVPLGDLAAILYFGGAITREIVDQFGIKWGFRSAPSGGALYPIDIFCVVNKVASLSAGLYRYDGITHSLQLLREGNYQADLIRGTYLADSVPTSGLCILMAANFARSKFKYGERAYRFVLLEAGHIAQNILLTVEGLGHSAFPIGGYIDDELNELIGVDGINQAIVYGVMVGCTANQDSSPAKL